MSAYGKMALPFPRQRVDEFGVPLPGASIIEKGTTNG